MFALAASALLALAMGATPGCAQSDAPAHRDGRPEPVAPPEADSSITIEPIRAPVRSDSPPATSNAAPSDQPAVSPSPAAAPAPVGTELRMDADWSDVFAAMDLTVSEQEMAIEVGERDVPWFGRPRREATLEKRYELLGADNRRATVVFKRESTASDLGPIRVTVRIGVSGDPSAERAFLRTLAGRLRALRARDVAPLQPPFGIPE